MRRASSVLAVLASTAGFLVLAGLPTIAYADTDDAPPGATAPTKDPGATAADDTGKPPVDGYCQWTLGVAESQADFFNHPNIIGTLAYIKEPNLDNQNQVVSGLRASAILEWNLIGLLQAGATKDHGTYDCKRHQALDRIAGETIYRALRAKQKVYLGAMDTADKILEKDIEDAKAHRTTSVEMTATRLRVNEIKDLEVATRQLIDALPRPAKDAKLTGALANYYKYDGLMEQEEGRLRRLQGLNVSIGGGYDQYLGINDPIPLTAIVQVTINTGIFAQADANARAAEGRRKMVRDQHQVQLVDTTISHIQDELKSDQKRAEETAVLQQDLEERIAAIEKIGGDDNLRVRDAEWFDYIKVKAEHAYYAEHVASLQEVLGEVGAQ
jgi:hypothetical protein